MDHINILKRAWNILWRYRALWIFGIVLAMTATGGSGGGSSNAASRGGNNSGSLFQYQFDDPDQLPEGFRSAFEALGKGIEQLVESGVGEFVSNVFPVIIALLCFGLIMFIISRIARWVSEVSLIRMVDHTEETGEQLKFKQGFRLGWSRAAWRMFLINLIIAIPVIVGAILLVLVSAIPALFFVNNKIESAGGVISVIATIGLFFLAIMVIILVGVAIGILERFFWRTCALEDKGVFESIREGYAMVRRNLKDVGILWLIMVGVQIGYAILTIPVGLLLLAIGALLGGGVGLSVGALMRAFTSGTVPWIAGGLVGLPIVMLVIGLPMLFLSGLKETYVSTVWTLTYRELRSGETLKGTEIPDLPELDAEVDAEVIDLPEPDEGTDT